METYFYDLAATFGGEDRFVTLTVSYDGTHIIWSAYVEDAQGHRIHNLDSAEDDNSVEYPDLHAGLFTDQVGEIMRPQLERHGVPEGAIAQVITFGHAMNAVIIPYVNEEATK